MRCLARCSRRAPERRRARLALILLLCGAAPAHAKPVAYQGGTTTVVEAGPHAQEAQVFYAPNAQSSVGAGWLRIDLDPATHAHAAGEDTLDVAYLRANVLAQRWNWSAAQANVYLWGGVGTADSGERASRDTVPNAGFQLDWESRRFYTSLKSDWHTTFAFTHGMSVVQLGVAPYLHDYDTLATWILLQGHAVSGDLHEDAGGALLLRLFWRWLWLEAGADDDGEPRGVFMVNL